MPPRPRNPVEAVSDRRSDVQDERLERVARLLIWEGRLSRARLMEQFGLSGTRASEWLKEFREARPEWVEWDTRLRSLVTTRAAYRAIEKSEAAAVELMGGAEPDIGVLDGDSALILPLSLIHI